MSNTTGFSEKLIEVILTQAARYIRVLEDGIGKEELVTARNKKELLWETKFQLKAIQGYSNVDLKSFIWDTINSSGFDGDINVDKLVEATPLGKQAIDENKLLDNEIERIEALRKRILINLKPKITKLYNELEIDLELAEVASKEPIIKFNKAITKLFEDAVK